MLETSKFRKMNFCCHVDISYLDLCACFIQTAVIIYHYHTCKFEKQNGLSRLGNGAMVVVAVTIGFRERNSIPDTEYQHIRFIVLTILVGFGFVSVSSDLILGSKSTRYEFLQQLSAVQCLQELQMSKPLTYNLLLAMRVISVLIYLPFSIG